METNYALGLGGYIRLMGDYYYSDTIPVKLLKNRYNLGSGDTIKVTGWLIS